MSEIAVIIPCFNHGRTIEEAVDSVLAQTWGASEIVVVDDGSSETATRQVLARLVRPRTRVVRTANRGPAAARNHGIGLTRAPYLVMLDADDRLEPRYLEQTAGRLDADPTLAFVSTALRAFEGAEYVYTPPAPDLVTTLVRGGPHTSTLFRRSLWLELGGFAETYQGTDPTDFWICALERGHRGTVIPEPLLAYRVRAGSRFRRLLREETWLATMAQIYARHRPLLESMWSEILIEKDRFLLELRQHQRHLTVSETAVAEEMRQLDDERRRLIAELQLRGEPVVDFGDLDHTRPLSPLWGLDRGRPLDRYYIEAFLDRKRHAIRGRVLELKDGWYTKSFGGGQVSQSDVLDIDPGNTGANIIADLAAAHEIDDNRYDCIVLTQALQLLPEPRRAMAELFRILAPGGTLLLTVPALGRISHEDRGADGDFWRFTEAGLREVAAEHFPLAALEVESHGNVLAATAFMHGLAAHEMTGARLDDADPALPVIVTLAAVKPHRIEPGTDDGGVILCYHRVVARDVAAAHDAGNYAIDSETFRAQMETLRREFRPVTLESLASSARRGAPAQRAVAVTFDDGTLDQLRIASAILLELEIPATFFVTTARLDETHEMWWDQLRALLPDAGARAAIEQRLYGASCGERAEVMAQLAGSLAFSPRDSHRVMTGAEIRELADRPGHHIGSHTANHLALTLQTAEVVTAEIMDARRALRELLGVDPAFVAWPYGEFNRTTMSAAAACGHVAAVTVLSGTVQPDSDPFAVPRLEVLASDDTAFAVRLNALRSTRSRA